MKKTLLITVLLTLAASTSAQGKASSYSMSCGVENDSLGVAVWYYWDSTSAVPNYILLSQACTILVIDDFEEVPYRRHGDTVFLLEQHNPVRFVYSIPLAALHTVDGVIDLRREDNWYPHRNDEVEYVMTSMWADDYHATLNGERLGVDVKTDDKDGIYYIIEKRYDGLHLILTPKNSQSDLSSIVSDMRNEVKPWKFEIRCKVTDISDVYRVGERQFYVITVEVADTTYNEQLGILYGKDYRDKKVELQIVSFDSGRECDGTKIKKGRKKYWFELTFWNGCPIIGGPEYQPYWNVDGVQIATDVVKHPPMKAEGLDGLCRFYRETNRIDPRWIIPPLKADTTLVSNDVCWSELSGLPGFYSLTGKKFTPGGAYDVVPLEASVKVELVDNDRVRISGTVADSKTGELIPYFSVYAVDTNAAKEYIIKSKVTEGNFDGSFSFTTKKKDGQMFILHTVGYAELLLQLHCSY